MTSMRGWYTKLATDGLKSSGNVQVFFCNTAVTTDRAYRRGLKAFSEGRSVYSCTYANAANASAWQRGWEDGRAGK